MGPFDSPLKTGFVSHDSPTTNVLPECLEYAFEWYDNNPEDEDRSGYGVSLLDGKLVVGGRPIIGVATRADRFNPSKQWVAVAGQVEVKTAYINGDKGTFDKRGMFRTRKNLPRLPTGVVGIQMEPLIAPIYTPYMYVGRKLEKAGRSRIIVM